MLLINIHIYICRPSCHHDGWICCSYKVTQAIEDATDKGSTNIEKAFSALRLVKEKCCHVMMKMRESMQKELSLDTTAYSSIQMYPLYMADLVPGNGKAVISDSRLHAIPYLQVGFIHRSVCANCNILAVDTTKKSRDTC